jgi:DNA-binding winged helix-turn-helix (wHTH) protein
MTSQDAITDEALPLGRYAFGAFRLDARRGCLTRDGLDVALTPKAHAVLEYLVRRPGAVVSKHALLAAVWPSVVVEEGNLSQAIYVLRRALGEQPADRRYVVTVPGRGYRFVAPVQVVDDARACGAPATDDASPSRCFRAHRSRCAARRPGDPRGSRPRC